MKKNINLNLKPGEVKTYKLPDLGKGLEYLALLITVDEMFKDLFRPLDEYKNKENENYDDVDDYPPDDF